jgi:hypothetical protein
MTSSTIAPRSPGLTRRRSIQRTNSGHRTSTFPSRRYAGRGSTGDWMYDLRVRTLRLLSSESRRRSTYSCVGRSRHMPPIRRHPLNPGERVIRPLLNGQRHHGTPPESPRLPEFEFLAASAVFERWAELARSGPKGQDLRRLFDKAKALEGAIRKGTGTGSAHAVPPEIVNEEVKLAIALLKPLLPSQPLARNPRLIAKGLTATPHRLDPDWGAGTALELHVHAGADVAQRLTSQTKRTASRPTDLALAIVASRFELGLGTIAQLAQRTGRSGRSHKRMHFDQTQALLGALFHDAANPDTGSATSAHQLFDALRATGYPPIALYHRVRVAARQRGHVQYSLSGNAIASLCDRVREAAAAEADSDRAQH